MRIQVHLYGRLRKYAADSNVTTDSVLEMGISEGDTIETVIRRIGMEPSDVSHLFVNHEYSALARPVRDGDRLGVFPADMALLYRQYFVKRTD